jgi:hypothetical protein
VIKKRVIFEVYGGLGNQLLSLLAGIYCQERYNRRLFIDCFYLDDKHSPGFDVTSLLWPKDIIFVKKSKNVLAHIHRNILQSLSHRSELFRTFERKVVGVVRESYFPIKSISELDKVFGKKRTIRMKGYFYQEPFLRRIEIWQSFT